MTIGWLLDTNVISELLKGVRANRAVPTWVDHPAIVWMLRRFAGNRTEERLFVIDAQIAATAEAASLRLCTRNVRDFERLGISEVFNPFEAS